MDNKYVRIFSAIIVFIVLITGHNALGMAILLILGIWQFVAKRRMEQGQQKEKSSSAIILKVCVAIIAVATIIMVRITGHNILGVAILLILSIVLFLVEKRKKQAQQKEEDSET